MTTFLAALGLAAVVVLYGVVAYNRLVALRNQVDGAWGDVQVQLKRRYQLIPNLVETVRGYAAYERATLEAVVTARNEAAANDGPPADQARSERGLIATLGRLFALAEGYPDLKASASYLQLQADLAEAENRIESARRFYNGSVRDFNTGVEQFPANLVARLFGFARREYFRLGEDEAAAAEPVSVKR
jgi:LemA protein